MKAVKLLSVAILTMLAAVSCDQLTTVGTQRRFGPDPSKDTLFDQQLATYPLLRGSDGLIVLNDFEDDGPIDQFTMTGPDRSSKRVGITRTNATVATGDGALRLGNGLAGSRTLVYRPSIRRWAGYNVLMMAVNSSAGGVKCSVQIQPPAGQPILSTHQLNQGWNVLAIDLTDSTGRPAVDRVKNLTLRFQLGDESAICIDDIILLRHSEILLGDPDGSDAELYAVQEGLNHRVGVPGRFEVVFSYGRIIGWYDLSTDPTRQTNLAGHDGLGPIINEITTDGTAKPLMGTRPTASAIEQVLTAETTNRVQVVADFPVSPNGDDADKPLNRRMLTYTVRPDGRIYLDAPFLGLPGNIAIDFVVSSAVGFEPVVGRIRNPHGPAENKIEYALLRRMGHADGADLLIAALPQRERHLPVACSIEAAGPTDLRSRFTFPNGPGKTAGDSLHLMMRVWPNDIDHLGNAERYVREYVLNPPGHRQPLAPR